MISCVCQLLINNCDDDVAVDVVLKKKKNDIFDILFFSRYKSNIFRVRWDACTTSKYLHQARISRSSGQGQGRRNINRELVNTPIREWSAFN